MKYSILATFLAFLFFLGCKSDANYGSNESSTSSNLASSESIDHTAIKARDHIGWYKGLLPCADCDGIETSLYLMANNAYLLTKVYTGLEDGKAYKNIGDFEWSDDGTMVTLSNMGDAPNKFIVEDTRAIQLDKEGNRVEGDLADQYILSKQ